MTGERRIILSNVSDEDLSIVSSDDRTRSQSQVDYSVIVYKVLFKLLQPSVHS